MYDFAQKCLFLAQSFTAEQIMKYTIPAIIIQYIKPRQASAQPVIWVKWNYFCPQIRAQRGADSTSARTSVIINAFPKKSFFSSFEMLGGSFGNKALWS